MPMRRTPALLALVLALCALPGVRAFASASCAPCCPESAMPADCSMKEASCCEVAPAAAAEAASYAKPDSPAPALVDTQRAGGPGQHPIFTLPRKGALALLSPLRLSVVLRL